MNILLDDVQKTRARQLLNIKSTIPQNVDWRILRVSLDGASKPYILYIGSARPYEYELTNDEAASILVGEEVKL